MYKIWIYITEPIGNNEFSYPERIALWSVGESPASLGKIFVPSLVQWNIDNLEIGSEICFEEAEFTESRTGCGIENWKLMSCVWLKHFVQLEYEWVPVYIVDNHNHALTFWHQYKKESSEIIWKNLPLSVIHIDQHADTKENNSKFRIQNSKLEIEDFVNKKTNVGNFISAALNSWIVNEVIQVRTDYALQNLWTYGNYILDIDTDFWVDKEITPEDIQIIRDLMKKAKLVTIATSPYFMDQKRAIEIIKEILQ